MPNLEGQVLKGRYRIEELVGRGGMAEVYNAWDTWRNYHVAVKVMREDLAEDLEFVRRFKREAQALAALDHQNIVRFYSFERDDLLAFIVMDYVEGTTLRSEIARADGPMPLPRVRSVLEQVCAALHYAHLMGVLHRDVKPGNIMIEPNGRVLIADFGIAKAVDAATATTVMPGTPAYMSPEQCRSEPLDARTDVYALGIVAYEMLAGRRPFRGDSDESGTGSTRERLRWEQMHLPAPALRQFNTSLSPELEAVVMKALAKERGDRWASVLEFWQAFEAALADVVPEAIVPPVVVPPAASLRPETVEAPPPMPQPAMASPASSSAVIAPAPAAGAGGPRLQPRVVMVGAILLGVVLAVVIGLILVGGTRVPHLINEKLDTARDMVQSAGYQLAMPDTQGYALDELVVVAQSPPGGEREPRGSLVEVTVEPEVVMPTWTPTPPPTDTTVTPTPTGGVTPTPTATPTEVPAEGVEMVSVPAGEFQMGSTEGDGDEEPVHTVSLDAYAIGKYEVTNAQFAAFLNEEGNQTEGGASWLDLEDGYCLIERVGGAYRPKAGYADHPVIEVTWYGAAAYCAWAGGRLPTEVEWEYAARGPQGWTYPWGNDPPNCDRAQYSECSGETVPVGSKPDGASWCGALDLAGNVGEWVADWYDGDYYERSPNRNPEGPSSGESRVLRGGSWVATRDYVRGAFRYGYGPGDTDYDIGFRCARGSP